MLKDKILAALKIKFANKGFSAKALEGLAEELAKTVTEEANIETAISGVEPVLNLMQGEVDRRVTEAVAKAKTEKKEETGTGVNPEKKEDTTNKPAGDEQTPAWAKAIIDQHKQLADKINTIEQGKTIDSRKSRLEAKLAKVNEKDKGRYLKNFPRMKFDTEEEFDAFLTEVEEDVKGSCSARCRHKPFQ